ncbi:hypothetical protein [Chondromyces apiculatus]|uniref:Very large tegument protein n=1 Tax=Chondromyces apiculatus DSM 436 TaxID=1192034 RepID=A0A017SU02_9BACT|nr:hypothetical protein [Chondromyces apiculatus]EYF00444.1 Very large tegument protein [Chondromyces apiculatus DSM 436]
MLRALFLASALLAAGCGRDIEALDLPWTPGTTDSATDTARDRRDVSAAPADCDILPPLSPEEISGPPHEPLELTRTSPNASRPPYVTLPDVIMPDDVASRMLQIDAAYFRRTGKHLTITSGTRDASRQAKAMVKMLKLGADVMRLYRNKEAVREIKAAYDAGRAARRPEGEIVTSVYGVLRRQIERKVYLSAHLRAGAVDVRNRDMTAADKKAFAATVAEAGGVSLLEETAPPHFHLEVD